MRILSTLIVGLMLCHVVSAQSNRQLVLDKASSQTGRKVALVIGNSAYKKAKPLANPGNDAADMAAALRDLGFEVFSGVNQDKRQMEGLIRDFGSRLSTGGTGLVYYAGHGVQVGGENYLIPIDADIPEEDEVRFAAIPLSLILTKMTTAKNQLNIVILDACRNNPFARSWRAYRSNGNSDGLAKITPPTGTLVLYATEPGKVASDGAVGGRNGLFTESLLKHIRTSDLEYDQMVRRLSSEVWERSGRQQLPWKEGNSLSEFYFAGSGPSKAPTVAAPASGTATTTRAAGQAANLPPAGTVKKSSIGMELVFVAPGEFIMGSSESEIDEVLFECRKFDGFCKRETFLDESPAHKVTVADGYWIGKHEVTQGQWQSVMGENPSNFKACGAECPVESVSWDDIQIFLKRLNDKKDGFEYSLPSEAQWEYAARAGTASLFAFGAGLNSSQANVKGDYPSSKTNAPYIRKTLAVGGFKANAWGIYDMHGNVWEWVQDIYAENYNGAPVDGTPNLTGDSGRRVLRGGAWGYNALDARSANRIGSLPNERIGYYGFRVIAQTR